MAAHGGRARPGGGLGKGQEETAATRAGRARSRRGAGAEEEPRGPLRGAAERGGRMRGAGGGPVLTSCGAASPSCPPPPAAWAAACGPAGPALRGGEKNNRETALSTAAALPCQTPPRPQIPSPAAVPLREFIAPRRTLRPDSNPGPRRRALPGPALPCPCRVPAPGTGRQQRPRPAPLGALSLIHI